MTHRYLLPIHELCYELWSTLSANPEGESVTMSIPEWLSGECYKTNMNQSTNRKVKMENLH